MQRTSGFLRMVMLFGTIIAAFMAAYVVWAEQVPESFVKILMSFIIFVLAALVIRMLGRSKPTGSE
jgi:ABC-type dipeptide/oligopeptide/nickel transport system permease subunit